MKDIRITISPTSVLMIIGILILIGIIGVSKNVILFLFASYIIAGALFPAVDWLSRKMPRWAAVLIVYLIGFIGLATIFIPFFAVMFDQFQDLVKEFPKYYLIIENKLQQIQSTEMLMMLPDMNEVLGKIMHYGENLISQSINVTLNIFTTVVASFTLGTIVLFILLDKELLKKGFLKFFPPSIRDKAEHISVTITKRVGGYVRGQLFVMFMVGLITGICLSILKIPFAFLLGLVAGVLEIIPIIGPILAAVPALLLALTINPWLVLVIAVLYLFIQRVENTISPFIYSKFLNMPPLIIITALLIAASTLGLAGVILSPAIAAAFYVLIQELYLNKINGKETEIKA